MTAFTALIPVLPIYIEQYGGSPGIAGLPLAALTIGAVVTRPLAGWALDTYKRQLVLLGGLIFFLLPAVLFIGMLPALALIFFRLIQGMGWGVGNTALSTIASDVIPAQRMGEGLGIFTITISLAFAYSPSIAFYILDRYSFPIFFTLVALLIVAAIVLTLPVKYTAAKPARKKIKPVFLDREAFKPAMIMLLFTANYSAVISFVSVYAMKQGVNGSWVFFTALALSILAVRPFSGMILDQGHKSRIDFTVLLGSASVIAAVLLLARTSSTAHLVAGGILYGIGFGIIMPVMLALSIREATPARRGAANATYWTAYDLGVALGSVAWGILIASFGYYFMYHATVLPIVAALFIYFFAKTSPAKNTAGEQ